MIYKWCRYSWCFEPIPGFVLGVFLVNGLKLLNGVSNLHSAIDNAAEELDQYDIDCKVRNGNIRIGNEKSSGGYSSKGQDGSSIKVKANTGSIEID